MYPGGYNWPLRGQKATLWDGGMRAVGFIHSPLIPASQRGVSYNGLVHVSDWFPTLVNLASNGGNAHHRLHRLPPGLDGHDQWDAITRNTLPSPRAELLHNIDVFGGGGGSGFGDAAIRVGDLKLLLLKNGANKHAVRRPSQSGRERD